MADVTKPGLDKKTNTAHASKHWHVGTCLARFIQNNHFVHGHSSVGPFDAALGSMPRDVSNVPQSGFLVIVDCWSPGGPMESTWMTIKGTCNGIGLSANGVAPLGTRPLFLSPVINAGRPLAAWILDSERRSFARLGRSSAHVSRLPA